MSQMLMSIFIGVSIVGGINLIGIVIYWLVDAIKYRKELKKCK